LAGRQSTVLGNGVDAAFWAAGRSAPRRHVVFAGRLVPEKGWREFLVILAGLSPDVTATVAGDGPDLAALRQAIRGLGLEPRVEVTGRLAQPLLRAAYAGSVYVNPSRAAEGFQTTLLEAGLAGARIATYDVGGAAEVVGSGGAAGRVVPAGDVSALRLAVSQLLEGETTSCPEVLWQYDWPRLADRFLAELIGARP
jgi:glycosyltransferase involved in cell wall biosynthesis